MVSPSKDILIREFLSDPLYCVDELGNIFTKKPITGKFPRDVQWSTVPWRKKSVSKDPGGYIRVRYKGRWMAVHRVIYQHYCGVLDHRKQVNHKDGDPSNNCFNNLEQVSASKNMEHSYQELGRVVNAARRLFTADQVLEIRRKHKEGMSGTTLSKKFKCSKSTIHYLLNGKTYRGIE